MKIKQKKCLLKHLFLAQFYMIMIFFQMKKSDFWPENWKGWSHNIETFHKEKSGVLEQKP